MPNIYIIHENDQWTAPLRVELDRLALPYREWFLDKGHHDLSDPPPKGVFYNRMSASSHTRNHRFAPEYTACVLGWLESHSRRVLNTGRALQLEVSKVAQYAALNIQGIKTPRTLVAAGQEEILDAARVFNGPFITKHNRGGKGLGVRLFRKIGALEKYVNGPDYGIPIDGITLVQEYIESPDSFITRCEFIGAEFLYAVQVDTSGGFELCPADDCQPEDAFCSTTTSPRARFEILKNFHHAVLERFGRFLVANGIHVAAIEFITDRQGEIFVYDVNTNTNYNPQAEALAGVSGMAALARYLGSELAELRRSNQRQFKVAT